MSELPLVVVVVVTDDPGAWLGPTLESLASQDYPSLRFVVLDTSRSTGDTGSGSEGTTEVERQVRHLLPEAEIHRLRRANGYGASANEVLRGGCAEGLASGAGFFVFCQDDVVLEPTAIRALVETACLCDAGVVGPKLVDWEDPHWLVHMGHTVDRTARAIPLVEAGEADQGQYDGLREVFAVPSAVTLVRAGLFRRIGGFDEAISSPGDNLSLCWRARLAGSRVVATSATRVRHRETLAARLPQRTQRKLALRHQLRILLTCTGRRRRRVALPVFLVLSLLRSLGALLTGSLGRAWTEVAAWPWNLLRYRSVWIARRQVKRFRRTDDRQLLRLQVPRYLHFHLPRSGARPRRAIRTGVPAASPLATSSGRAEAAAAGTGSEQPDEPARSAPWTAGAATVACALVAIFVLGSRHLLTRGVPQIGQLVAFNPPGELFEEWTTGWRRTGLGSDAPIPTLYAALAGLGSVVGGYMELLRTLLTIGLVPVGVAGAFRSLRALGATSAAPGAGRPEVASPRAALAAAVAYAAFPLPYVGLAAGRWDMLAVYAAAPWVLTRLCLAGSASESQTGPEEPPHSNLSWPRHVLVLGLITALLALVAPVAPALVLLLAVGLAVGSLLTFEPAAAGRQLGAAAGGLAVSALLHLPWTVAAARSWRDVSAWWGLHRPSEVAGGPGVPADPVGSLPLALDSEPALWALLVAAGLPLVLGRRWRLAWAVRGWAVAVVAYGLVWASQRSAAGLGSSLGDLPLPRPELMLILAGAGLALAAGCGLAAVENDTGSWPQWLNLRRPAAVLVATALLIAVGPVAAKSLGGSWDMPRGDLSRLMASIDDEVTEAPARVLWLGHPDALPGDGWRIDQDLEYLTTLQSFPAVTELLPGPADPTTRMLEGAVTTARSGRTARLGQELAPMAVQYIAVPLQRAPSASVSEAPAPPQDLLNGLANQLDLERVPLDPSIVLYRNLAFPPTRDQMAITDLDGHVAGGTVLQPVASSGRWGLFMDGVRVQRTTAFGWANSFQLGGPGSAELRYETPFHYKAMLVLQLAGWITVAILAVRLRKRRVGADEEATVPRATPDATSSPKWISLPQEDHEYVRLLVDGEPVPSEQSTTSGAERAGV